MKPGTRSIDKMARTGSGTASQHQPRYFQAHRSASVNQTDWNRHWTIVLRVRLKPFRDFVVWRMYKRLLKPHDLPEQPTVIELGIGEGYQTIRYIQSSGGRGLGIDRNPMALFLTRKAWHLRIDRKKAHPNTQPHDLDLIRADLQHMPVRGLQADLVHSEGVLEHFNNDDQLTFLTLHRNLSKRYVIIFTPRPSAIYTAVRKIFTSMGKWLYPDEVPLDVEAIKRLGVQCGLRPIRSTVHIWENGVLFERLDGEEHS